MGRYEPTAPWNEESMDTLSRIASALETLAELVDNMFAQQMKAEENRQLHEHAIIEKLADLAGVTVEEAREVFV